MGIVDRNTIKAYFERGDQPTEAQFIDTFDSEVSHFPSMQDMVDATQSANADGQVFILKDFYSASTGGGGVFEWSASESKANHNGGTIIDPNHSSTPGASGWWADENTGNGCYVRRNEDVLLANSFGATGDGSTDDYDAIQASLDYLESIGGGKLSFVYKSSGYYLGQSLSIQSNIEFDGNYNEFLSDANGSYDSSLALIMGGQLSSDPDTSLRNNIHIKNVFIDNPEPGRPLYLRKCQYSSIKNCVVKNASNPIFCGQGKYNEYSGNYLENCTFQGIAGEGNSDPTNAEDYFIVKDNIINGANRAFDIRCLTRGLVSDNIAIDVFGFIKNEEADGAITITGNICQAISGASATTPIFQVVQDYTIITDNYVYSAADDAIVEFLSSPNRCLVSDNVFIQEDASRGMVRFTSSYQGQNNVIKDNIFIAQTFELGIIWTENLSTPTSYLNIEGNTLIGEGKSGAQSNRYGMFIREIDNCNIGSNTIDIASDTDTVTAIYCSDTADSKIYRNDIINGADNGINISSGTNTNSMVFHNDVTSSGTAINIATGQNIRSFLNIENGVHNGFETYTPSNVSADRTFDADATTTDELADVLGTLINDLQNAGIIQ